MIALKEIPWRVESSKLVCSRSAVLGVLGTWGWMPVHGERAHWDHLECHDTSGS